MPSAVLPTTFVPRRLGLMLLALAIAVSALVVPSSSRAQTADGFFSETGYAVDYPPFLDFFQKRGGVRTFGYPVSRTFTFLGCTSQFFQRLILQQCGNQGVGTLNLLDQGLLPYTSINGSTLPSPDASMAAQSPNPSSPTYPTQVVQFVQATAPDTFEGEPVNFFQTFQSTVQLEQAFPDGNGNPALLPLLNLELWGLPTSQPQRDPGNRNFIYQRFQRGVMHYDATCRCTQALLLADYLKAIVQGENIPADLEQQAQTSPLYRSAVNGQPPSGTIYATAFSPGRGDAALALAPLPTAAPATTAPAVPTVAPAAPTAAPTARPATPPAATVASSVGRVNSPDYGLSMFIWGHPGTTNRDLGLATSAGFRWQKTLFQWKLIEGRCRGCFDWTEADRVVRASNAAGVKIIARLDFQPSWARRDGAFNGPPDNYQDFNNFVTAFVNRYKAGSPNGTVHAIEVWNEVNIDREWGGQPINRQQAADYVRLLDGAYRAAKAIDPSVIVITAGLSPTGVRTSQAWDDVEYMQWLFDAGMKGKYDVLGAHGNTQAPEVEADFNSLPAFQDASFYFRRIEQLREVQVRNGDADKQIWLLEFGWTSDTVHPAYAWFAVSEQKKAENIVKAFQFARANWSPWIGVMTLWTFPDPTWNNSREEYWWAIMNADGSPRPAYTRVKESRQSGLLP